VVSETPLDRVLGRLDAVRKTPSGFTARCPVHDDRRASLSVSEGDDGRVLVCCHAGCDLDAVVQAIGLVVADLFPKVPTDGNKKAVAATYDYTDEDGGALFQVVRYDNKTFAQRRPDGHGGWTWKLDKTRRVPYRVPQLLAAVTAGELVVIVEGEKDVHTLEAHGLVATTNPMGAGNWRKDFARYFVGATVVIIGDCDDPGRKHAFDVAEKLRGAATTITVLELDGLDKGGDVTDWFNQGHTVEQLRELIANAPLEEGGEHDDDRIDARAEDGAVVLDDLALWFAEHLSLPSDHYATVLALWAAHTHLIDRFESTPRLAVLSPEKQCGKTRALELLDLVCDGAERLSDASASYMFRRIAEGSVTILLDEADAIWKRGKADESADALRSICNAGHRKGAYVGRVHMNGKAAELQRHAVYAPVALAGIGNCLPDTILDRSIVLTMRRIAPYERVTEYRERTTGPAGRELRERLAAWAASVADMIGSEWPEMPAGVRDRAADVWEPLIVVADLAGGDWPLRVRDACAVLIGASTEDTTSLAVRLLHDLYEVFRDGDEIAPARSTETILDKLHGMDEAPWGDWYGRRFAPRDLARMLRPFGVKSQTVRIGETTAKGYRSDDLRDPWARYGVLPTPSDTPDTSVTPLISTVTDVTDVTDKPPTEENLRSQHHQSTARAADEPSPSDEPTSSSATQSKSSASDASTPPPTTPTPLPH
jgi:hypothetical protein